MSIFWIVIVPFVPFFCWMFWRFSRVDHPCLDCGAGLSLLQSPLTWSERQWAEGGYLCRSCGREADILGQKVPRGAAPSWLHLVVVLGVPALGIGLFTWGLFVLQRAMQRG